MKQQHVKRRSTVDNTRTRRRQKILYKGDKLFRFELATQLNGQCQETEMTWREQLKACQKALKK